MKKYVGIIALVSLFIAIISVVAILIARGYNFTENELKANGIIEVVSVPEDATIYINEEEKGKTPKKFELQPGTYSIRVAKDQYSTWTKDVVIEASIVNSVNAALYPEDKKLSQLTFVDVDRAFFSQDGDIAIYTVSGQNNPGIWTIKIEKTIFELSSSEPQKIAEIGLIPRENREKKNYKIDLSTDNKKAILELPTADATEFMILDLNDTKRQPLNVNSNVNFNPINVKFDHNSENLLITDNSSISRYNIEKGTLELIAKKSVDTTTQLVPIADEQYVLLDNNYKTKLKELWRLSKDLKRTALILPEEIDLQNVERITASSSNKEFIAISTSTGAFLYNITRPGVDNALVQIAKTGVNFQDWSPDGSSLLFVNENNLQSVSLTKRPDDTYKTTIAVVLIDYSSDNFKIRWSSNSSLLVVNDLLEQTLSISDKDGQNRTVLYQGVLPYTNTYTLSKNSTFLVILLKDSELYSNLYTITLKI